MNDAKMIRCMYLLPVLFIIARSDYKSKIIPNRYLIVLVVNRLIFLNIESVLNQTGWNSQLTSSLAGFVLGGGLFLLCYLVAYGRIGAGDVKLFAILGFWVGSEEIVKVIFCTLVYAAFYNVFRILKKEINLKQEIPLGQYAFLGIITSMILNI